VDPAGLAVLVGVLVLATGAGLLSRARAGRVRAARVRAGGTARGGWALAGRTPAVDERVLLLQLSSAVCAPCRQTAAVLEGLTARPPGLVHAEVDVGDRPDTARELGVLRTPTVVAFDRSGAELLRVSGVPRAAELASALAPALVT
jgi:thiol-disulfide isomerase/thioredoxin